MNRNVAYVVASVSIAVAAFTAATTASAQAAMPQPQTQGSVSYLNGGAGSEEVDFIKSHLKDYSLALMFSRKGGEYTADVAITIKDAHGATVFDAPSTGPYLLLKLPSGTYSVTAIYHGDTQSRPVTAEQTARTPVSFVWS